MGKAAGAGGQVGRWVEEPSRALGPAGPGAWGCSRRRARSPPFASTRSTLPTDNSASLAEALRSIMLTRRDQANFQLIVITHDEMVGAVLCGVLCMLWLGG